MTQTDVQQLMSNPAGLPRTTTLVREAGLRTLLLHLNAGERIAEHQTRGAIVVQCLQGKGAFFAGAERVDLRPGVLLSLPPAEAHSVRAAEEEDILLLVTMAEQSATER